MIKYALFGEARVYTAKLHVQTKSWEDLWKTRTPLSSHARRSR